MLAARANNERVNKARRRAVIFALYLIGLDREKPGALQKLIDVIVELLLIGALSCHGRAFGRRGIIRFGAELIEASLDPGEAGRQAIDGIVDRGRNRIDLLTQILEFGIGQIVTLEACFDLFEGGAEFVERPGQSALAPASAAQGGGGMGGPTGCAI